MGKEGAVLKLQNRIIDQKHCIRVPKIYDWVTRFINIKEKEFIKFPNKTFEDCICSHFRVHCHEPSHTTIWTALNTNQISATLSIKLTDATGCKLDIFVNGEKLGTIHEGQSFNATVGNIQSVDVQCHDHQGKKEKCCCGEFEIVVHYGNECSIDFKNVKCFLSDSCGVPINSSSPHAIKCKEVHDEKNRPSRNITLPNGNIVTLQEVNVMKCGFITVQFFNRKGKLCKCCTFPFSEVETFFLCAPPGTRLECEITDFDCKVFTEKISCECAKVFISITICQSIQMVGDVKLELKGRLCEARENEPIKNECPSYP